MARKNKVESSLHYNEIVERLSCGESGRSVSRWLEDTYNEKISFAALNRYKAKNIKMEDRVEAELNKRRQENNQEIKSKTEDDIQSQAEKAAEDTMSIVAETIADNMEGVAKVAGELPIIFERTKNDAKNPNCKTEWKDVAKISIQANRIYNDYFKHEEDNIEININEGFGELADAIKKSRELCKKD